MHLTVPDDLNSSCICHKSTMLPEIKVFEAYTQVSNNQNEQLPSLQLPEWKQIPQTLKNAPVAKHLYSNTPM